MLFSGEGLTTLFAAFVLGVVFEDIGLFVVVFVVVLLLGDVMCGRLESIFTTREMRALIPPAPDRNNEHSPEYN